MLWAQFNVDENGHCVMPAGTIGIGDSTFSGCSGLQSIKIQDGVTSIEVWVFSQCRSLQSIEIPDSIISIVDFAFYGCRCLSFLILHYDDPINLSPTIVNNLPISDKITLHVPIGTGYAYRHHLVFSKVKEVIADVR